MSVTAVVNIVPTHEALTADRDFLEKWAPVMLPLVALLDCLGRNFHSPRKDGADANTLRRQMPISIRSGRST